MKARKKWGRQPLVSTVVKCLKICGSGAPGYQFLFRVRGFILSNLLSPTPIKKGKNFG